MGDDVERVDLSAGRWVSVIVAVACIVSAFFLFPWYSSLTIVGFAVWGLWRMVIRQATSITFNATGLEIGLLFRTRYVRKPVAEFTGSRFRGISVHDLRTDKIYELSQYWRNARLVRAAERHGYPVVSRSSSALN